MKKEKVRRPNSLEIANAVIGALFESIYGKDIDPRFEQVQLYFKGPVREAFIRRLESKVNAKGEYVEIDPEYGVLIKKLK